MGGIEDICAERLPLFLRLQPPGGTVLILSHRCRGIDIVRDANKIALVGTSILDKIDDEQQRQKALKGEK